ncbi:MAG: T9SS type A sorting domain-containing protein [Bacteroidota bacterium]|nr:T9SS type A sorting domain-containing protein [Bacteroidota bacterium]
MKTIILFLILFTSQVFAQITLTGANNPSAGDIYHYTICDTTNITQGNAGANQTWSFLSLTGIDSNTLYFVAASTTPYAAQFPTSNIAATNDNSEYSYISASSANLLLNGSGGQSLIVQYNNPQMYAQYPFTYNTNFTDNFSANYTSGGLETFRTGTTTVTGDAFGTINLSIGSFANALRVKNVTITNDSTNFGTTLSSTSISYSWFVTGRKLPVFEITYISFTVNGFPLGNEKIVNYNTNATIGITNISSEIPDNYLLSQNYPNPFNPVTNLEFGISKLGFVTLKIYDMLGKEVATLVNSTLNPGTYKYNFDASGLTSGVYFYKITAGDFVETKRMNLVK